MAELFDAGHLSVTVKEFPDLPGEAGCEKSRAGHTCGKIVFPAI